MSIFLLRKLLLLVSLSFLNVLHAQEIFSGFSGITGTYNDSDLTLKIWYPTNEPSTSVSLGYFDMVASKNAEISAGKYGLVIISHGDGSSDLNHRNIGLHLSKHGYIVAAIMHPHNNYKQNNHSRKTENWVNRPQHISKSLDLIEQSQFQPYVDNSRISIVGYSAGAYTAIASIGGKADISNIEEYCSENAENDPEFCGNGLLNSLRTFFQQPSPAEVIHLNDTRIDSAVVLAPMGVQFYGSGMLDDISVPVLLLGAEFDDVLPRKYHAEYLANNIKSAIYEVIPGAGHYSFITPFPKQLLGRVGDADKDPPGFDREGFMEKLEDRILTFLNIQE